MSEKASKISRTLDLYECLCEGKIINKSETALKFGVDERSIQRDIDDIRMFLSERGVLGDADGRTVKYERTKKGYVLEGAKTPTMSNSEILAVTKILLESRAFTKDELNDILDKLVQGCVPLKNMEIVSDLIRNEQFHYVELHHKPITQEKLWDFGKNVRLQNVLEIEYSKADTPAEKIKRTIEPVALLFSEYYFYINAYIVEKNAGGEYVQLYDYPAIFRLDRISAYKEIGVKFHIPYAERFKEGEFRKRIQFMYAGKLMKIRLKYFGNNPEPVLDRLPTAEIIEQQGQEYIIEAEVYGKGIVMWLLSQGQKVEVLKPESLRNEMREKLAEMMQLYRDDEEDT